MKTRSFFPTLLLGLLFVLLVLPHALPAETTTAKPGEPNKPPPPPAP